MLMILTLFIFILLFWGGFHIFIVTIRLAVIVTRADSMSWGERFEKLSFAKLLILTTTFQAKQLSNIFSSRFSRRKKKEMQKDLPLIFHKEEKIETGGTQQNLICRSITQVSVVWSESEFCNPLSMRWRHPHLYTWVEWGTVGVTRIA